MKKLFTLLVIVSVTFSIFAQSPQKMSYQCVVRNASGVLMTNQTVGMKISILQGSTTGTITLAATGNLILSGDSVQINGNKVGIKTTDLALEASNLAKMNGTQIGINATNLDLKGQAALNLEGAQTKVTATVLKMEGSGQAELKGSMVKVEGSGTTVIKGGLVTIN